MRAPEFPGNLEWLNSEPLKLADLLSAKKLVMIDFWTYSCVNCLRTIPHLSEWQKKYDSTTLTTSGSDGLVIIGAHTPEFEFEKKKENVEVALKNLEVTWPVVLDPDYKIWHLYANSYWPRKFLINPKSEIVYDHIGEGGYAETENKIVEELIKINPMLKLRRLDYDVEGRSGSSERQTGVCYPQTPELYLGNVRGNVIYPDTGGESYDSVYLDGDWKIENEHIESVGPGYIRLIFRGVEVNLVMEAEEKIKISLELDGKPAREIEVKEPKMYNLVKLEQPPWDGNEQVGGELKIHVPKNGLRAYALTFGGCV